MVKIIIGENDLATTHPWLAEQWHPTKNVTLTPQSVTAGSNRKVWWKCTKGHEWQSRINHRRDGIGCPYCSGEKAIPGETDLATTNPSLAAEWNYSKNNGLTPQMVKEHSNKKVWWICRKNHEWDATVNDRSSGKGCPYCSGRKPIKGETDLKTKQPALVKEWDHSKNKKAPSEYKEKSDSKVWWVCEVCSYNWKAPISSRSKGHGCPACAGIVCITGKNDLATRNPELAMEFHTDKNGDLTAHTISVNSNKKIWWKGKCGHEWQATVSSRNAGNGCPICANQIVSIGINDLATTNPQLASQWHPTKNENTTPQDITAGSNKKAWWLCPDCRYEWNAVICSRKNGTGCPMCHASNGEKLIRRYLDDNGLEWKHAMKFDDLKGVGGQQLSYDFAVYKNGSIVCLLEYQGSQHYYTKFNNSEEELKKQQKHDHIKAKYAAQKNIPLITINYDLVTYKAVSKFLDEKLTKLNR